MFIRLGALLPILALVALVSACGGGGPERSLTEGEGSPSPIGTPPIFQRSPVATTPPVSPGGSPTAATPTPTPTAGGTPVVRVAVTPVAEPFQVTVNEAVNVRDRPSASEESTILGGIYPGDKAKVVGEARGQEVEPGKGDLWYQVELTRNGTTVSGFVYAPFVVKV